MSDYNDIERREQALTKMNERKEVTPQELRKKLVQLFVYAQNPDEKLMHLHGVEEDILAAFDAMAEKAEAYDKLQKPQGYEPSPYFNFDHKDIQEIKYRVEVCHQDRLGSKEEREQEEKEVGHLLEVIEGLHIVSYQQGAENWKKLGHAIDTNKIRGLGFVIMNPGRPEHMHCMTSIGLAEALRAVPESPS